MEKKTTEISRHLMLKLSYKTAQEKLARLISETKRSIISEMEQSLIEYFNRTDTPNYITINKHYLIEAVDEEFNSEFFVENVCYSDEYGHIELTSYDNGVYGYLHNQNWNTIQRVYSAVEFAIEKMYLEKSLNKN